MLVLPLSVALAPVLALLLLWRGGSLACGKRQRIACSVVLRLMLTTTVFSRWAASLLKAERLMADWKAILAEFCNSAKALGIHGAVVPIIDVLPSRTKAKAAVAEARCSFSRQAGPRTGLPWVVG